MISAYGDANTIVTAMGRSAEQFHAMPVDFPKLKQCIMAAMGDARGNG
jgi:DNA-binding NtrC family response regulator